MAPRGPADHRRGGPPSSGWGEAGPVRPERAIRRPRPRRLDGPVDDREGRSRVEMLAAVLLAVATVATAWSGYQSTRWNGEQAKAGARANALRIDSAKAAGLANSQTQVDVATFTQWVDAYAHEDDRLAG